MVAEFQLMTSSTEAQAYSQFTKCPCNNGADLTRSESRLRFSLKKSSHGSVNSLDDTALDAGTLRSRRSKVRKGGILPTDLKLFLSGSRKSSDASDISSTNNSSSVPGSNATGSCFLRSRSSQSSTDTAIGDCTGSSSSSRTPSRKLSADMDQLLSMYKKEVANSEELVLGRVNDLDVKVRRTLVNLAALSARDCAHETCTMVQLNVAKKLLDKTFKAATKCRAAVLKFLLKQHDKVWRMAHLDGAEVDLNESEMKLLFSVIHTAFKRIVALANEVLQSVYTNLQEWEAKLSRLTKVLLKPCRGARGMSRRDTGSSRSNSILATHVPEVEMPEPYAMKYASGNPFVLIELVSPGCVVGLDLKSR